PPKISTASQSGSTPSSLLAPPPVLTVIAPTPEASPITPSLTPKRVHHKSVPETPSSVLRNPNSLAAPPMQKSWSSGSTSAGKRKAEEELGNTTPPKEPKEQRATFAPEPRTHRASASSVAPSSYRRKRARLSLPSSSDGSNPPSRTPSRNAMAPHTRNTSWSRSHSTPPAHAVYQSSQPTRSRRSLSQASIPISALISPHAPSVSNSGKFHMRDPRKPAPVQSTPWSLALPSEVESGQGSPLCAWFFFVGFVLFPLWWIASFVGVPKTRRLDDTSAGGVEKGVILDDPQVEYDARSWRLRCRIMAGVSLVTYIPFIVCIAIFA
ncbi:hypothetical protein P691DRAFT_629213, partial [Macrolepiota fuliginosa MF-IS2]